MVSAIRLINTNIPKNMPRRMAQVATSNPSTANICGMSAPSIQIVPNFVKQGYDKFIGFVAKGVGKLADAEWMQKATKWCVKNDVNYTAHLAALCANILNGFYMYNVSRSKKIEEEQKGPLMLNMFIGTLFSTAGGYLIDGIITKKLKPIEDAIDIAKSVKEFYIVERCNDDANKYYNLYNIAVNGAELGNKYSVETDAMAQMEIISEAGEMRQSLESDSIASKIFNISFDYYSIRLKTPEEDAIYYSTEMKKAIASGQQSQVDAISRIIGMVFERYKFDCSDEAAALFNTRLNELIATE